MRASATAWRRRGPAGGRVAGGSAWEAIPAHRRSRPEAADPVKHVLLGLLEAGPAHGYELRQRYDELLGGVTGSINAGQVYVTLGRLERAGLLSHRAEDSDIGPARKVYALTEDGHKALRTWLESSPAPAELRSDALMKVMVALELASPELPGIVRGHRQQCLEALRALDQHARGATGAVAALVQAAALHLQADLRWLDVVEDIAHGAPASAPADAPTPDPREAQP